MVELRDTENTAPADPVQLQVVSDVDGFKAAFEAAATNLSPVSSRSVWLAPTNGILRRM